MTAELEVQAAIYAALNGRISATVYDDVPALPEGQPLANFPYVVIGEDTHRPFDTDDRTGADVTVTLHIWSRYGGMKEAKDIAGEIYAILNRASLAVIGFSSVDCLFEFADFRNDPDGETRHGIVRYRATLQSA